MMTNRELYRLVTQIRTERSLEEYLRAVWALGRARRQELIGAEDVAAILVDAVQAPAPSFDDRWRQEHAEVPMPTGEFVVDWENTILFQIVELRTMAEDGLLERKDRYLGLQSRSGASWYNFDPLTFLECGVRGTVGGYEQDEVVVLVPDPDGDDSPVFELTEFGWDAFTDLLWCGQYYE